MPLSDWRDGSTSKESPTRTPADGSSGHVKPSKTKAKNKKDKTAQTTHVVNELLANINNNLTDDDDIARQKICFYAHVNVLARKFRFCSSGIKNVLFHSYCGTMYTSSLWCKFKKQSLKSVNVAYNNSFRIKHHLPSRCSASFMFVSNHIKSFNGLIRSSIFSLLRRLQDSVNPLFLYYLYTDIHFRSPMFTYWTTQL